MLHQDTYFTKVQLFLLVIMPLKSVLKDWYSRQMLDISSGINKTQHGHQISTASHNLYQDNANHAIQVILFGKTNVFSLKQIVQHIHQPVSAWVVSKDIFFGLDNVDLVIVFQLILLHVFVLFVNNLSLCVQEYVFLMLFLIVLCIMLLNVNFVFKGII